MRRGIYWECLLRLGLISHHAFLVLDYTIYNFNPFILARLPLAPQTNTYTHTHTHAVNLERKKQKKTEKLNGSKKNYKSNVTLHFPPLPPLNRRISISSGPPPRSDMILFILFFSL